MNRSRVAVSVFVLTMATTACATGAPATAPAGTTGSTASSRPPVSSTGAEALPAVLDFSAPALGGGTVEGAAYAGKDLALWFWAPW